jgi:hypothetical protein
MRGSKALPIGPFLVPCRSRLGLSPPDYLLTVDVTLRELSTFAGLEPDALAHQLSIHRPPLGPKMGPSVVNKPCRRRQTRRRASRLPLACSSWGSSISARSGLAIMPVLRSLLLTIRDSARSRASLHSSSWPCASALFALPQVRVARKAREIGEIMPLQEVCLWPVPDTTAVRQRQHGAGRCRGDSTQSPEDPWPDRPSRAEPSAA